MAPGVRRRAGAAAGFRRGLWGVLRRRGIDILALLCMSASTVALLHYRSLRAASGDTAADTQWVDPMTGDETVGVAAVEERPPGNRHKAISERAVIPLPSLEGLEVVPDDMRATKQDVFINQGNYGRLMERYNETIAYLKSFPTADMRVLSRYQLDSCAVVGNAGSLLNSSFGGAIDSHDAVVRLNQAPVEPPAERMGGVSPNPALWRKNIGKRTTFRLVNTRWAFKYGEKQFLEGGPWHEDLPLENQVTIVVTRAPPKAYDAMAKYMRAKRVDVSMLYLSSHVISHAHDLLVSYRARLEQAGRGPYLGGDTPSSGYVAVYMMLTLCNHVTAYGFGLDATNGRDQEYHYFHLYTPAHSKKKNSMNPTHSFDAERDLLRALAAEGHLTFCEYQPGRRSVNRHCGLRTRSHDAVDEFTELAQVGTRVTPPARRASPKLQ